MHRYGVVYADIWNDEDFKSLSQTARLTYIYLLSSPHSNMAGFYNLPPYYACYDIGISEKEYLDAIKELHDENFAYSVGNYVLVRSYLKHNPVQTDKQAKGAWTQIERNPLSQLTVEFVHSCILYSPKIIPFLSGEVIRYIKDHHVTIDGIDISPRLETVCPLYSSLLLTLNREQ